MIFVSIAAYRDPLLMYTVQRARATASRPNDLYFGIVDQSNLAGIDGTGYFQIDPKHARGPCWARSLAMSFYEGQDWFLQIDSHTSFDPGWDERLIAWGRPRTVITTYPERFIIKDGHAHHQPRVAEIRGLRLRPESSFQPDHYWLDFEPIAIDGNEPVPGFHVGGCCLFAPGAFVDAFPYDPYLYFRGEEQSLALRIFTHGWDILHPPLVPIYHLYREEGAELAIPLHWDDDPVRSAELDRRSRERFNDLIEGRPLGVYGLGTARTLADYAAFSGIDYAKRTIEPRAYSPQI